MTEENLATGDNATSTTGDNTDATASIFGDKAVEALKNSAKAADEPTSTGDGTSDGKGGEKLLAGKYKNQEALIEGHENAQRTITQYKSELDLLRASNKNVTEQFNKLLESIKTGDKKTDSGKPTLSDDVLAANKTYDDLMAQLDGKTFDGQTEDFLKKMLSANKNMMSRQTGTEGTDGLQEMKNLSSEVNMKLVEMDFARDHPKMYKALSGDVEKLASEFSENSSDMKFLYGFMYDAVKGKNIQRYVDSAVKHAIASLSEDELIKIRTQALAGGSGIQSGRGVKTPEREAEELFGIVS